MHIPVHEKKHRFFGPIKFNRDPKKKSGFRAFHRSVCAAGPAAPKSAIWPIRKNSTVERKKSSERPKASQLSAGKDFLRLIFREFWRCVFLNAFEGVTRSNFRVPENPENSSRKPVPGGWFPGSRARRTEEKCQNFWCRTQKTANFFIRTFRIPPIPLPVLSAAQDKNSRPGLTLCTSHESSENRKRVTRRKNLHPGLTGKNDRNLKLVLGGAIAGKRCAEGAYFFSSLLYTGKQCREPKKLSLRCSDLCEDHAP